MSEPYEMWKSSPTLQCQLLFVENRPKVTMLDVIALEPWGLPNRWLDAGTPLSLELRPPVTRMLPRASVRCLERWADEGRVLELRLVDRDACLAAVLSSDGEELVLDVDRGD